MLPAELAYRKTAAESASGLTLLLSLYDTLAGDIRRAAAAEQRNDIATRCCEVNHAFMVIAFLEDRVSRGNGGDLAERLSGFYSSLRRQLIRAQSKRSSEMLEDLMDSVLEIRKAWQQVELRAIPSPEATPASAPKPSLAGITEHTSSSWSA
jgi:flagellar biosynthetic protein FliS